MPDLSHRVAKLAAVADRSSTSIVLRLLLAGTAVLIAISSIPPLVFGEDGMDMGMSHVARHFGAFSMAFAVGLLVVALRPARARTMLPVAFVVAMALAITAVFDASEGRVTFLGEGEHLPELASLALVWLLVRTTARAAADPETAGTELRLVHDDDTSHREAG
jgi:peptidoglycan/LPS O-acetylase OafA/YrhL